MGLEATDCRIALYVTFVVFCFDFKSSSIFSDLTCSNLSPLSLIAFFHGFGIALTMLYTSKKLQFKLNF